jgi:ribosomal protein S12 methylthiotransferase accessory factor
VFGRQAGLVAQVRDGKPNVIDTLVSPLGVVGSIRRAVGASGLSRVHVHVASLGSGVPGHGSHRLEAGTGRVLDNRDLATTVAIAEAAERYAGVNLHDDVVSARWAQLDGPALDMSRVPRCSAREYAHPRCPVVPFDDSVPIRWVHGIDLVSGEQIYVPAVMACYGAHPEPAERFWYQISTGSAVHTDPRKALLGAILEVIERDSVAILWLQRLALPLLASDLLTDPVRYLLDWSDAHFIKTYLFDATTDLGVPTVYCLQVAEHDRHARHVVGCATAFSLAEAAEKALLESLMIRGLFYTDDPLPDDLADFSSVTHSARYMARPEHADAFAFLVRDSVERRRTVRGSELPADLDGALRQLIRTLAAMGMQAVAVDRTPRELADVGLTAVAVIIPDLQPMSLRPLAQFRGHPRLYTAPGRMGYRCLGEEELNPWPQPFA